MRMDKLTSKFQMALADAQSLAVGQDHQFIEPVHLMIALLDQQGGSVRGLLTKSGANVWTGRLYNPEDCKWYSARATVNGNALQLTGGYKVLGQYIGKTANFRRSN